MTEASKRGRSNRRKGAERERQIVRMHLDMNIYAEKVPHSGAVQYKGKPSDVDVYINGRDAAPWVTEVKARKNGEGFVQLERWLGDNQALYLVRNRKEPLVVLPWASYAELVKGRD